MRSKALLYLFAFTFLICTTQLDTVEALGQGVRPVTPNTGVSRPPPLPPRPLPTSTIILDSPRPSPFVLAPQPPVIAAPRAAESNGAAATAPRTAQPADEVVSSGTPQPDTATSDPDGGGEETPTPETTPTATPPQPFIPTPSPNDAGAASSDYRTPSPSPTETPSPMPDDSTSATNSGYWWLWIIPVVAVVLIIRSSRRRDGHD
jgi:hypothetical protein